jgi:hypothetical protein
VGPREDIAPAEAVAAAQAALDVLGISANDPLFIHLGA